MRGRGRSVLLALFLLLSSFAGFGLLTVQEASAYTTHAPIAITCDLCFTPSNGITGGSGTPADPYIVDGWDINASFANGITIRDTTAHFVIRNVYVHAGPTAIRDGIYLQRVSNGRIEDVLIEHTDVGILLSEHSNIVITRVRVQGSVGSAIGTVGGSLTITDSIVRDSWYGLSLNSWPIVVSGNEILNNSYGLSYRGGTGVVIERNNITTSRIIGIEIANAFGITVTDNQFVDNARGLQLGWASEVTVSNNRFTNDSIVLWGDNPWHFRSHTITPDNLINGLPVDYRKDCGGVTVDGAPIGELIIANCTNVQVRNLNFRDVDLGIALAYVDNATVASNAVVASFESMTLYRVTNLTFSDNIIGTALVGGQRVFDAKFASNRFTSSGVTLREGGNLTVTGNTFAGPGLGVYVERSSLVNVTANEFSGGSNGVNVWSTTRLAVTANLFRNASGVSLAYVSDSSVNLNTVLLGEFGISAWQSSNVTIHENAVVGTNRSGLLVSATTGVTLRDNYVAVNGDYGILMGYSSGALVAHNEFSGNALPAADDRGPENAWDDGYQGGGNYWSNYTGADNCSGPAQNVCPDPDGFGDTPFVIDGDTQDRYPLISPPFGGNTPPKASFTVAPATGTVATSFAVNASGSTDAEDPTSALQVRWDWEADGTWDTLWSGAKVAAHSYPAPGTYTVRLLVRDTGSLVGETTRPVTVANTAPTPAFTVAPASGDVATQFAFDASGSSDLEDPPSALQMRWDWEDDGTWDTPWSLSNLAVHSYPAVGTYRVRLEVRDTGGMTASVTQSLEVVSTDFSPPEVAHTPPGDVRIGEAIAITARVTDNRGVTEVVLHYRGIGEADFRSVAMASAGNDAYSAEIPPQSSGGFVAYYLTAKDGAGLEARSPPIGEHTVRATESPAGPSADSWAITALAVGVVAVAVLSVIGFLMRRRRRMQGPGP